MIPPELILEAYRMGVFPMALKDEKIGWFSPDPRGIIPLDERFHISHGLRRTLKKNLFEIRFDSAFEEVIEGCAQRSETWISEHIANTYIHLHHREHAHSVETWKDGKLVGGLYGLAIGGVFFGESMFSRTTDASKVALVALVERLRQNGFQLLDTQWSTPHLATFGAIEIPRVIYLELLEDAVDLPVCFHGTDYTELEHPAD